MSYEYLDLLCMGCFSRLEASGTVCPYCGFDEKSYEETPYQLPLRTILGGKYMVGKVLGEGGFGITYIGYDLNLDAKVAVKEFYPSELVTRETTVSTTVQPYGGERGEFFTKGRDKFVDEAKRLAKFRVLPGIVLVNDFLAENGTAYIIMEYVEGQTLKDYIAQAGGKLPPGQVIELLSPVFGSLAQIHESGIIHRDISPDNVMITGEGNVKLLDFGAAREFGDGENKSLSVMLKHGYAPVEQYSTKGVQGSHTDVYALSATIYKAITGITPENSMDRAMDDTVEPPGKLGVVMQENQEVALMKGLAIRYQDRYQTASELYSALLDETETAPQSPSQPQPPTPEQKKGNAIMAMPKKNKIIAGVVAACVVLAVILALTIPGANESGTPDGDDAAIRNDDTSITDDITTGQPVAEEPEEIPEEEPANVVAIGAYNYDQCDVSEWRGIIEVAAGDSHTLGLKPDGTVLAVGRDREGQCKVSEWQDIISVDAGNNHSVGLKSDGTVVAVGENKDGQCNVSDWSEIVAISADYDHTLGLKSDGTVVAAGKDSYGQTDVSGWRDMKAVTIGFANTYGIRSDGTVIGTREDDGIRDQSVPGWRDIVEIAAGREFIVGLRADGTVIADGMILPGFVYVWQDIISISASSDHVVGLRSNGTVVAGGSNEMGKSDVSEWRNITAISAGKNHTVGLIGEENPLFDETQDTGNDGIDIPELIGLWYNVYYRVDFEFYKDGTFHLKIGDTGNGTASIRGGYLVLDNESIWLNGEFRAGSGDNREMEFTEYTTLFKIDGNEIWMDFLDPVILKRMR